MVNRAGSPRDKKAPPPPSSSDSGGARHGELKVYGFHACMGLAKHRIHDIVRVYCTDQRIKDLSSLLHWCAKHRRAYHIVAGTELNQISGSLHHEGVCVLAREKSQPSFDECLRILRMRKRRTMLLYLGGITNPFNLGAIVRVAAHFGVHAILVDNDTELTISGAVYRIAEGGVEHVPIVRLSVPLDDLKMIRKLGFQLIATSPKARVSIFKTKVGQKTVFMLGSEASGLSRALIDLADKCVNIPGTGYVESLNLATAAAVISAKFTAG